MKFQRICNLPESNSFFLFGPRGTGKTSLIRERLGSERVWTINLLEQDTEDQYARRPDLLWQQARAQSDQIDWVFIDEVQKVPRLLDVVHNIVENTEFRAPRFALTGSSARKLRRGAANLMAGRAFVYHLYPLTHLELGDHFDLDHVLNWGTLPRISALATDEQRSEFLRAYGWTYLKEEVWAEHIVDDLDPFRLFIEVAAQANGTIVNYANVARDAGINEKTVKRYFEILEETLLGFYLNAYPRSVRKRQIQSPKFYLFDRGVTRALARLLSQPVIPRTNGYGDAFEHFVIAECVRLNDYYRRDFQFSYFRTKDDVEIDLIVDRPGMPLALIEIKSSTRPTDDDVTHLKRLRSEFGPCECYCFSNDPLPRLDDGVHFLPWQRGMREIGLVAANGHVAQKPGDVD